VKMSRAGVVAVALTLLCCACADDADYGTACSLNALAAVSVQIVGDRHVVAVTATRGGVTRPCTNLPPAAGSQDAGGMNPDYVCFEMGGGEYVITVHGDEHRWVGRVQVKADECHVIELSTIVLDLSSEPAGSAELAVCSDGSERRDCCKEATPQGPCSTSMLYCAASCELPSPEAKIGARMSYSCSDGHWTSNGPSQCVRPGVGKEEL
jgi:hypothetical protein